jgi:hypothetical protein
LTCRVGQLLPFINLWVPESLGCLDYSITLHAP